MRFRLLSAAALLCVFACQRGQQDAERNPANEAGATAETPAALIRRFAPIVNGVWVRADYLDALSRTKSPLQSSEQLADVAALAIDLNRAVGDSVLVAASLNNHEGYELGVFLRSGQTPASLPTSHFDVDRNNNFYELSYAFTATDTTLLLNRYDKRRRLLGALPFRRVWPRTNRPGAPAEALTFAVQRLLFAGRYTATDSVGRSRPAELTADGKVRGLATWKTYTPTTDFVITLANDRDNLVFDAGGKRRLMTYQLSGDTLRLYAAKVTGGTMPVLKQGRLHYTLVRRR